MIENPMLLTLSLIFGSAALLAMLALYMRQALLVAYLCVGITLGPHGLSWIDDPMMLTQLSELGIVVLLFLLGVEMKPQHLLHIFVPAAWITAISSLIFGIVVYGVALLYDFSPIEALALALSSMFSSTIVCLKLLPAQTLLYQRLGDLLVGVLLLQDMLAILLLIGLDVDLAATSYHIDLGMVFMALVALIILAIVLEKMVLRYLFIRFQSIHEFLFLLTLGWCLGFAQLAQGFGLSPFIGAFIGGVALSQSPFARFIDDSLKPIRDFFMVLFFFSVGADLDLVLFHTLWQPILALASFHLFFKAVIYAPLFRSVGVSAPEAVEASIRLSHGSEFALILSMVMWQAQLIDAHLVAIIQGAALLSFVMASTWTVMRYSTPIYST